MSATFWIGSAKSNRNSISPNRFAIQILRKQSELSERSSAISHFDHSIIETEPPVDGDVWQTTHVWPINAAKCAVVVRTTDDFA